MLVHVLHMHFTCACYMLWCPTTAELYIFCASFLHAWICLHNMSLKHSSVLSMVAFFILLIYFCMLVSAVLIKHQNSLAPTPTPPPLNYQLQYCPASLGYIIIIRGSRSLQNFVAISQRYYWPVLISKAGCTRNNSKKMATHPGTSSLSEGIQ